MKNNILSGFASGVLLIVMVTTAQATIIKKYYEGNITNVNVWEWAEHPEYKDIIIDYYMNKRVFASYIYNDELYGPNDPRLFVNFSIEGIGSESNTYSTDDIYHKLSVNYPNFITWLDESHLFDFDGELFPDIIFENADDVGDGRAINYTESNATGRQERWAKIYDEYGNYCLGQSGYFVNFELNQVPEPSTIFLFVTGFAGLIGYRRS